MQLSLTTSDDEQQKRLSTYRVPPEVLKPALSLQEDFEKIRDGKICDGKVWPALEKIAGRHGFSAESLNRKYYGKGKNPGWLNVGLAALIDHRLCRGCRMNGCTTPREITIPQETIDHWKAGADGNGGYLRNDKRGKKDAWKANIISALQEGKVVPGLGTWQQLYLEVEPFKPLPKACPWHIKRPPPGLSLSSFNKHKSPKSVELLARKGEFAMWPELPEVTVDLSTLRALEWIVFDDHRIDALCEVEDGRGGVQVVEMWGLFAMDVATRRVIAFGLRPRINRTDGTAMGLTHADLKFLMASILSTYGLPKDHDMTFIVENAAAAVSHDDELLLAHVTGGKVKIKRSGLHSSDALLTGHREKWGNFRGKSWLESWFALFDILMGTVKGQIGSDYWAKPGRSDGERRVAERMCALMGAMTDEQRQRLTLPYKWAGELHGIIDAAVDTANSRVDHECVGFEPVRFFKLDKHGGEYALHQGLAKLHGTERELDIFTRQSADVQNLWLSYGHTRMESPKEKFARLHDRNRFMKIAEDAFLHLMLNESVKADKDGNAIVYRGGDTLSVWVKQGTRKFKARFEGPDHELSLGQEVRVVYTSDNLEAGIFILDDKRRPLGRMRYSKDPLHDDLEGLHRQLGAQIKAKDQVAKEVRRIVNTRRVVTERIEQEETSLDVVLAVKDSLAPTTTPALEESSELVRQIFKAKPRPAAMKRGIMRADQMAFTADDDS